MSLGLTAATSAIDAAIQKQIFGSGTTTLIISNLKMNDVMEMVKSIEESGLFIRGISKSIKNEATEQKVGFPSMLLGTLDTRLLGNLLTGKCKIRGGEGAIATSHKGGTIKSRPGFLMRPHLLTNFEIQKCCQNEPKFYGVYSINIYLK